VESLAAGQSKTLKTPRVPAALDCRALPPNERRPGYFSSAHGIAVDPTTRPLYVNDRNDGHVQVFDENGKFLDQWDFGPRPPMDVRTGRVQKYTPRKGANPEFLVGTPWPGVW
jgi:DNA-binding beta-propeller fold protein YncE